MSLELKPLSNSFGVSRNLTQLFKKYRSASKNRKSRFHEYLDNFHEVGNQRLLSKEDDDQDFFSAILPPQWVDNFDEITEELVNLKEKIGQLQILMNQRLQLVFGDSKELDYKFSQLSNQVLAIIHSIEKNIKDLKLYQGSSEDDHIRRNITQSLANRLSEHSQKYRKIQQKYIDLATQDQQETQTNDTEQVYQDDGTLVDVYNPLSDRSFAINDLVRNITELSEVFKDLQNLIVVQGTILDRIDYNIEQTVENTSKANIELVKASQHQKCTRAVSCIIMLLVMIFILIVALVLKHVQLNN